jgi:hypothetical protein
MLLFSCLEQRLPFFLSARRTMKFKLKTRDYWLLGIVAVLAILFAVMAVPADPVVSDAVKAVEIERSRFSPTNSLDVAMAMKLVTHDPPKMLAPPSPSPVQLLYPPSAADLERLSGPM